MEWESYGNSVEKCTTDKVPEQNQVPRRTFIPKSSVLCIHKETNILFRVVFPGNGNAHIFIQSEEGLLPRILAMLKKWRKEVQAEMKKYARDDPMYHVLNARQNAIKLIMNSIYGLTGSAKKGKYPMVPLAESTTCSGREFLTYVVFIFENDFDYFAKYLLIRDTFDPILKVQKYRDPSTYNLKYVAQYLEIIKYRDFEVVYGDTDSNMLRTTLPLTKEGITLAFLISYAGCKYVNPMFPPMVNLDLEKVYAGYLLQRAKRYAGAKVEGKWHPTLDWIEDPTLYFIKTDKSGIEVKRRDNYGLLRKTYDTSLDMILPNVISEIEIPQPVDSIPLIQSTLINMVLKQDVTMNDFVYSKSLKRDYSKSKQLPEQAVVRDKIKNRTPGQEPHEGSRVNYVKTRFPAGGAKSSRAEDPDFLKRDLNKLDMVDYIDFMQRTVVKSLKFVFSNSDDMFNIAKSYATSLSPGGGSLALLVNGFKDREQLVEKFKEDISKAAARMQPIETHAPRTTRAEMARSNNKNSNIFMLLDDTHKQDKDDKDQEGPPTKKMKIEELQPSVTTTDCDPSNTATTITPKDSTDAYKRKQCGDEKEQASVRENKKPRVDTLLSTPHLKQPIDFMETLVKANQAAARRDAVTAQQTKKKPIAKKATKPALKSNSLEKFLLRKNNV